MTIPRRVLVALPLIAALVPVAGQEKSPQAKQNIPAIFTGVKRVVAMGDIHADPDVFLRLLRQAGLIGPNSTKWTGGETNLVLTGDFVDRGPNSAKVIELLM